MALYFCLLVKGLNEMSLERKGVDFSTPLTKEKGFCKKYFVHLRHNFATIQIEQMRQLVWYRPHIFVRKKYF